MIDRLISGAGALADRADRFARLFTRHAAGDRLGARPGSIAVAAVLAVLSVMLVLVGLESTDDPTERTIAPAVGSADLGDRLRATITGSLSSEYVDTFLDVDGDGVKDADEVTSAWFYYLVDPATHAGVAVRSTRPPSEVLRLEQTGEVREDTAYVAEDLDYFTDTISALGIEVDAHRYVDATVPVASGAAPDHIEVAAGLPADGSLVTVAGSRTGDWYPVCTTDPDRDGRCDDEEIDAYDVLVYDPASKRGVVVVTRDSPEFVPATLSGMLRRDEREASEAVDPRAIGPDPLDVDLSPRYVLEDGALPATDPLAYAIAAICGVVAGIILVGVAGGYLIYRRGTGLLPPPVAAMAVGERIPVAVTGILRTATGPLHVREAAADLVRYQTSPTAAAAAAAPTGSTLIVERAGRPEGVALGRGDLRRMTAGTVFPLRGARPALRVVAGTGPLLLSFASAADRERAAAELLAGSGLGARDESAAATPADSMTTEEA